MKVKTVAQLCLVVQSESDKRTEILDRCYTASSSATTKNYLKVNVGAGCLLFRVRSSIIFTKMMLGKSFYDHEIMIMKSKSGKENVGDSAIRLGREEFEHYFYHFTKTKRKRRKF